MKMKITFGKNLKYYRFQKKYTQEQLSEMMNITPQYLSELERGMHSLDFDKIEIACKYLEIQPYQLFEKEKEIILPRRIDMH